MAPGVSGQGTRGQGGAGGGSGASGHLGHETRGGFWGWREAEAGVCGPEPGSGLRPGPVTGSWGCGPRPLLPTLSSGHIAKQPGPGLWPTKYSRFFSPLKCVLNLLSFSLKSSHTQRIPIPNSAQRGQRRFGGSYSARQGWYGYEFQETLIVMSFWMQETWLRNVRSRDIWPQTTRERCEDSEECVNVWRVVTKETRRR